MPPSLSELVRALPPGDTAYVTPDRRTTWGELDTLADEIACALSDLQPGERVGIRLPDDETVHAAFLGTERAGVIGVGIGARARIAGDDSSSDGACSAGESRLLH